MGYNENFLGDYNIHLPKLGSQSLEDSVEKGNAFDYTHFSIVMNRVRKLATYTAHNIDGKNLKSVPRNGKWSLDPRVGDNQTGNEAYSRNPWDRGHLVRRTAVAWGDSASKASSDTFYFTNAAPQHENFNQDEWLELENWLLAKADQSNARMCVFTGPIFQESDQKYRDIFIPTAFWKVIVLKKPQGGLSSVAFLMKQDEMWDDKNGKKFLNLTLYQVAVSLIEELADLSFTFELGEQIPVQSSTESDLKRFDPLANFISENKQQPWPVIKTKDDIVV
ncbi:DNA/RNA non-specific endonuclease [Candidatus Uabimicrobium sp. HlEnr_7]|uniref:DNA/RNA non-specific endonuclease n=1 Tax=Candidatus Uabimicrobium helgolandensis TaxID=3095367 RepID=UPI003556E163